MRKMFRRKDDAGGSSRASSSGSETQSARHSSPSVNPKLFNKSIDVTQGLPPHFQNQNSPLPPGLQTYKVGVASDCNSNYRKSMEDAHCMYVNFMGSPSSALFCVFDGHAGGQCSQICAKRLPQLISDELETQRSSTSAPEALAVAFRAMDELLENENIKNSGSTVAAALLRPDDAAKTNTNTDTNGNEQRLKLFVANCGDTRVVLARGGRALRLSYDHRASDTHEAKRIHNAGGIVLNSRVNSMLAVTRSLGDLYMKDYVLGDPYTTETAIGDDDSFFIVACDGVWDVISDQDAVDLVKDLADPREAAEKLVRTALQKYSTDNLTALVVRLR